MLCARVSDVITTLALSCRFDFEPSDGSYYENTEHLELRLRGSRVVARALVLVQAFNQPADKQAKQQQLVR